MKVTGGQYGTLVLTLDSSNTLQQTDVPAGQDVVFTDKVVRCVDFAAPSDVPENKSDRAD